MSQPAGSSRARRLVIELLQDLHRYGKVGTREKLTGAVPFVGILRQPARRVQQHVGVDEAHRSYPVGRRRRSPSAPPARGPGRIALRG